MLYPILTAIISSKRPHNIQMMEELCDGLDPIWYVPESETDTYLDAGAQIVIGLEGEPPAKGKHLNCAMEDAFDSDKYLLNIDDDIQFVKSVTQVKDRAFFSNPIKLELAVKEIYEDLEASPYYLAGASSMTNPFYTGVDTKYHGAVQGKMALHKPNELRYDENIKEYEDADYNIRHHLNYGGVIVVNRILVKNKQWTNPGGYVDVRDPETSKQTAAFLNGKYGKYGVNGIYVNNQGRLAGKIPWKKLAKQGKESNESIEYQERTPSVA